MSKSEILFRREFRPDHAQLQFGAVGARYPEWGFGTEPVVADDEMIVVATLPDFEGKAMLEIWKAEAQEAPDGLGILIHEGVIQLKEDAAEVGSYLGGSLEQVLVGRGQHRVRVFVDEPGYAKRIVCLVTPNPSG